MLKFDLYAITPPYEEGMDYQIPIEQAIAGGIDVLQFRTKGISDIEFFQMAQRIRGITLKSKVPFIINDRVDVALAVEADGVHLGSNDIPLSYARKILDKPSPLLEKQILGFSAHTPGEIQSAKEHGADYVAFGPVYPTPYKKGRKSVGTEMLKKVKETAKIPIIAIGGINLENLEKVIETGVDGVAAIRAIFDVENIEEAVKKLKKKIAKTKNLK